MSSAITFIFCMSLTKEEMCMSSSRSSGGLMENCYIYGVLWCTGSACFWLLSLHCKISRYTMENRERRQNGRSTGEILPSETPLLLVL